MKQIFISCDVLRNSLCFITSHQDSGIKKHTIRFLIKHRMKTTFITPRTGDYFLWGGGGQALSHRGRVTAILRDF